MKIFYLIAVFAALCFAPAAFAAGTPAPAPQSPIGRQISALPVQSMDGKQVDIAAQPGWKVVYFFSTVCKCVYRCEQLSFVPLATKYAGQVSFYAIDSNWFDVEENRSQLSTAIQSHRLPYPVFLDTSHQAVETLNATTTPETFVLDPSNRIVFAGMPDDSTYYFEKTGGLGLSKTYLSDALAQALSGKKVTQPQAKSFGCDICPTPPK